MPQVILHSQDNEVVQTQNVVRNTGLQSIVNREDSQVANLIADAQSQSKAAKEVEDLAVKMTTIIKNLIYVANTIGTVIEHSYVNSGKMNKYIDISMQMTNLLSGGGQ